MQFVPYSRAVKTKKEHFMEERLSPQRSTGIDRNTLRLIGLVIAALGILGRGILQNRVLGASSGTNLWRRL